MAVIHHILHSSNVEDMFITSNGLIISCPRFNFSHSLILRETPYNQCHPLKSFSCIIRVAEQCVEDVHKRSKQVLNTLFIAHIF